MTEFTARISYVCPVAHMAAGNEFMAWVGAGLGDRETFTDGGEGYALASGVYKPDMLAKLGTPVTEATRPEWGADLDLTLAQQGQAALVFEIDEETPNVAALASKGKAGKVVTALKGVASGAPEDAPAWQSGVALAVGDFVQHGGTTYMAIQAHTTQVDWTPDVVPALFVVIPSDAAVWQAGVQYAVDDEVTYEGDGLLYVCIQAHTSQVGWEPPNVPTLWRPVQAQYGTVYGPFTTSGTTYWIGNRGTEWGVGFNLDDDNDADVWLTMEELAALALSAAKKRAIRNKAKSLGWPE